MMSRKEYMYWQNRKDRVSEYICVRASGASERFFNSERVFNSFTVKKVSFFTINVKFKVILSSKSGGMFVQATPPPTQKSGGIHPPIPPPPGFTPVVKAIVRYVRHWLEGRLMKPIVSWRSVAKQQVIVILKCLRIVQQAGPWEPRVLAPPGIFLWTQSRIFKKMCRKGIDFDVRTPAAPLLEVWISCFLLFSTPSQDIVPRALAAGTMNQSDS